MFQFVCTLDNEMKIRSTKIDDVEEIVLFKDHLPIAHYEKDNLQHPSKPGSIFSETPTLQGDAFLDAIESAKLEYLQQIVQRGTDEIRRRREARTQQRQDEDRIHQQQEELRNRQNMDAVLAHSTENLPNPPNSPPQLSLEPLQTPIIPINPSFNINGKKSINKKQKDEEEDDDLPTDLSSDNHK